MFRRISPWYINNWFYHGHQIEDLEISESNSEIPYSTKLCLGAHLKRILDAENDEGEAGQPLSV
jgi:hypothetical protein